MRSHLTREFRRHFERLPRHVQQLARDNYRLWKSDPGHPGLQFKQIHSRRPIYSIRIGIGWRALAVKDGDDLIWFWIGSHSSGGYFRLFRGIPDSFNSVWIAP